MYMLLHNNVSYEMAESKRNMLNVHGVIRADEYSDPGTYRLATYEEMVSDPGSIVSIPANIVRVLDLLLTMAED